MPERVFYEAQEQTLRRAVGVLQEINDSIGEGGIEQAVATYLADHGVAVGYSVTDGDHSVVLTTEEGE